MATYKNGSSQTELVYDTSYHVHKLRTDNMSITSIANEFVQRNSIVVGCIYLENFNNYYGIIIIVCTLLGQVQAAIDSSVVMHAVIASGSLL